MDLAGYGCLLEESISADDIVNTPQIIQYADKTATSTSQNRNGWREAWGPSPSSLTNTESRIMFKFVKCPYLRAAAAGVALILGANAYVSGAVDDFCETPIGPLVTCWQ